MLCKKLSQTFVWLVCTGLALCTSYKADATTLAESFFRLEQFRIIPTTGAVQFLADWQVAAFAEAQNSLGETQTDFDISPVGCIVLAEAVVTYARSSGAAASDPPPNFSEATTVPAPEPSSTLLMLTGLGLLAAVPGTAVSTIRKVGTTCTRKSVMSRWDTFATQHSVTAQVRSSERLLA